MENKFKVGDYVKANEQGNTKYSITDYRMRRGKVSKIINDKRIEIEIIAHKDISEIGRRYQVYCEHFDLCEITPKDIQFADVVTLRNNERYVVASDYLYGEYSGNGRDRDELDEYNDDLTYSDSDYSEYDIVKVERNGQVIYEREVVEMTIAEISEKLGYEVKIIKE